MTPFLFPKRLRRNNFLDNHGSKLPHYPENSQFSSAFGGNDKTIGEDFMELIKIICAIILPPLGVFLQVGIGKHFWINIILTLLGYIPGIAHAIWVVVKNK